MIHAIYIYFILNAFIAGYFIESSKYWQFLLWLFFGCLYPLLFIISIIGWIDDKIEFRTLFLLYFSNYWKRKLQDEEVIKFLRRMYPKSNRYRQWILRQVDKKYKLGITE